MPAEILPTYLGNYEIEESDRSALEGNAYGLDTFVATYTGPRTAAKVARFLAKLKAGATHRELTPGSPYIGFGVTAFTETEDRSWATFPVTFAGKWNNEEPPAQEKHSLVRRTSEIHVDDQLALEVEYLAPRRVHSYVTKTFPAEPRYGKDGLFRGRLRVMNIRQLIDLPRAFLTPGFVNFQQISVMEDFTQKQSGLWWECEEEWVALLMPYVTMPDHSYLVRV